jgi:nitrous oxide reductase accessory protein NosL
MDRVNKERAKGLMQKRTRKRTDIKLSRLAVPLSLLFTFSLFTASCGQPTGAVPAAAKNGRCPVCGMMASASDDWSAEIYYKGGTKLIFESPADMISFYDAPAEFKGSPAQQDRTNIERIIVKDYQSKQAIDARQSRFVYKSKVEGPMGQDFLPFSRDEDAKSFAAANGGEVVGLEEITRNMAQALRKN